MRFALSALTSLAVFSATQAFQGGQRQPLKPKIHPKANPELPESQSLPGVSEVLFSSLYRSIPEGETGSYFSPTTFGQPTKSFDSSESWSDRLYNIGLPKPSRRFAKKKKFGGKKTALSAAAFGSDVLYAPPGGTETDSTSPYADQLQRSSFTSPFPSTTRITPSSDIYGRSSPKVSVLPSYNPAPGNPVPDDLYSSGPPKSAAPLKKKPFGKAASSSFGSNSLYAPAPEVVAIESTSSSYTPAAGNPVPSDMYSSGPPKSVAPLKKKPFGKASSSSFGSNSLYAPAPDIVAIESSSSTSSSYTPAAGNPVPSDMYSSGPPKSVAPLKKKPFGKAASSPFGSNSLYAPAPEVVAIESTSSSYAPPPAANAPPNDMYGGGIPKAAAPFKKQAFGKTSSSSSPFLASGLYSPPPNADGSPGSFSYAPEPAHIPPPVNDLYNGGIPKAAAPFKKQPFGKGFSKSPEPLPHEEAPTTFTPLASSEAVESLYGSGIPKPAAPFKKRPFGKAFAPSSPLYAPQDSPSVTSPQDSPSVSTGNPQDKAIVCLELRSFAESEMLPIQRNAPIGPFIKWYCKQHGVGPEVLSFIHKGKRVRLTDTPAMLQNGGGTCVIKVSWLSHLIQESKAPSSSSSSSAVAAAPEPSVSEFADIFLEFRAFCTSEFVTMKRNMPLRKAFAWYSRQRGVNLENIRFAYKKRTLKPTDTPHMVHMGPRRSIVDVILRMKGW